MAAASDPTGGDFHSVLEESIELVAQKNLDTAKNKKRAFKGFVTRLIADCNKTRNVIRTSCPKGKEADWNNTLLQKRCDTLLSHKAALLRHYYKWSAYNDSVAEILEDEDLIAEVTTEAADEKARVDKEVDEVDKVISQYYVNLAPLAQGAAAAPVATPNVKVEKELKPVKTLDVSDTLRDFEKWINEYRVYHSRSNFAHALVPEQRSFLARCMSDALWRRATALESPAEAKMPLDPSNTQSGIFYYILGCFGTSDPLLSKRSNLFSEKSGRMKCSGQGKYESYPAFLARLNQRLLEADFDKMNLDQIKQALILHYITDPELLAKVMEKTDPSPDEQHMVCMRYHEMQQKTAAMEGSLPPATISLARAVKTCVRCNANNQQRGAFCGPCGKDIRLPSDQQNRVKYFECTICKYVGHHLTAACSKNNKDRVHIERGEKEAGGPPRQNPPPRPRGGGRGGRRGPTAYSNKSRGFRGGGNVPARAVAQSDTRSYTVTDSGDESDLDESTAYETTVEENSSNINVVRVTLTHEKLSAATSGSTYRVDPATPKRKVRPERHWRLKALARSRRVRSRFYASPSKPTTDSGATQGKHRTLTNVVMKFLGRLISMSIFLSKIFMGKGPQQPVNPCPTIPLHTIRIMPETVEATVSRVAPSTSRKPPALGTYSDPSACPDLDNMQITLGNALAEKRGKDRVRQDVQACPDTGAARSICSPTLAINLGARIHKREKVNIIAANGAGMTNAGTATLRVIFQDVPLDVDMLLTPDIGDRCLIGLPDLKRFNIVPKNFPCILPSNI